MIVPPSTRHLVVTTLLLFQLCSCDTVISAVETHAATTTPDVIDTSTGKKTPDDTDNNATRADGENEQAVCTSSSGGDDDGTCQASSTSTSTTPKCGVYLALSTLPGTGIGMFAGRDYIEGQDLMELGDHVIPIVDVTLHQTREATSFFLWDDYTWDSDTVRASYEGVKETNAASPGFGAAANSYMDFLNVDEGLTTISGPANSNLHRSKDPGVGGFTYFHSREITASKNITQGQELFVSYGNHWFIQRRYLGPIPIEGTHLRAQRFYEKFKTKLLAQYNETIQHVLDDMWDSFALNNTLWESRILAALPTDKKDYETMLDTGLIQQKTNKMVRSDEWLQEYGVCADNFRVKVSTMEQAGHGVFANRFLKEGSVVLPVPTIHIPDREVLNMYEIKHGSKKRSVDKSKGPTRKQLLLNYVLGHDESSMVLSPYGPVFNLVNHNQTLANVRLQWANPKRSNHHPEHLDKDVDEFYDITSSQIALELVTLRDIDENDEIFLDYGNTWERAWQDHIKNWKPVKFAETYVSAITLNEENGQLLTEFEQMKTPYPGNVGLKFDRTFAGIKWRKYFRDGGLQEYKKEKDGEWIDCEILRYKQDELNNNRTLYTVVIADKHDDDKPKLVKDVPRDAFVFVDRPYTSDMLLPNAFRHYIGIPDDIFPEAWKNLKKDSKTKNEDEAGDQTMDVK